VTSSLTPGESRKIDDRFAALVFDQTELNLGIPLDYLPTPRGTSLPLSGNEWNTARLVQLSLL
jgi:hypothetical protein